MKKTILIFLLLVVAVNAADFSFGRVDSTTARHTLYEFERATRWACDTSGIIDSVKFIVDKGTASTRNIGMALYKRSDSTLIETTTTVTLSGGIDDSLIIWGDFSSTKSVIAETLYMIAIKCNDCAATGDIQTLRGNLTGTASSIITASPVGAWPSVWATTDNWNDGYHQAGQVFGHTGGAAPAATSPSIFTQSINQPAVVHSVSGVSFINTIAAPFSFFGSGTTVYNQNGAWTNPDSVKASDARYAYCESGDKLGMANFGFSFVSIDSIRVAVKGYATDPDYYSLNVALSDSVSTYTANGNAPSYFAMKYNADSTITYTGTPTNWNWSGMTANNVNDTDFGVLVWVNDDGFRIYIDNIAMTIYGKR